MGIAVDQVMKRDVLTLTPDMSVKQMDCALLEREMSGAPVVEHDRLVGVVSRADVVRALYEDQKEAARISDFYTSPLPIPLPALEKLAQDSRKITKHMASLRVREIMTPDPITVGPSDDIERVAQRMATKRVHRLPVVEGGALVGIVSSLDLVGLIATHGLGAPR